MYAPHTVTVYTTTVDQLTLQDVVNITILRGVFLDLSKGTNVRQSGLEGADAANLYIPFSVEAVDGVTLLPKTYIGAVEYNNSTDKTQYWTLDIKDRATFFVKGEVVEPDHDFEYINLNYSDVYAVTKVDPKDFGSPEMQHFEVGGN